MPCPLHCPRNVFIARQQTDHIAILSVCASVCPSVRLSVHQVPVFYGNSLRYCHSFFTTQKSNHSCFISIPYQTSLRNSDGSPPAGALNCRCGIKFRDFRPVSRCISQTIQNSAMTNRKPHPSYWMVMTLSDFKIRPFFDAEYLRHG